MRLILLTLMLVPFAMGANILGITPVPAKSHNFLFQRLMIALANAGHNVTFVSVYPIGKPVSNLKELKLPFNGEQLFSMMGSSDLFSKRDISPLINMLTMPAFGRIICDKQMNTDEFRGLLQSDSQFDLIIGENFVSESINAVVTYRFKAPLILFSPVPPTMPSNILIGNIAPTSFIPNVFLGYPQKMTFLQRTANLAYELISTAFHYMHTLPKQEEIYRQFVGDDAPPMVDILFNTSLMFTNDHYSLSYTRPAVPNLIPIGGIHVNPPKKLPEDIQKHLDGSKDGAILFSMGSNLKSSDMPKEKVELILNTFGKLKQNILWKFETDLPNKPKNVLISNWLPQSDILAHPNIKLFITHGGGLSTTESVDRGVPILGIPIFGDQPQNMKQSVNAGVGLSLNYDTLTAENFYSSIREILDNPKYANAAKERSQLLKDVPIQPLENALFWTEYVLRHKGAPHLRSALQDLRWYEAQQVDAIAFIISLLFITLFIVKKVVVFIFSKLFGSKKTTASSSKKKN